MCLDAGELRVVSRQGPQDQQVQADDQQWSGSVEEAQDPFRQSKGVLGR